MYWLSPPFLSISFRSKRYPHSRSNLKSNDQDCCALSDDNHTESDWVLNHNAIGTCFSVVRWWLWSRADDWSVNSRPCPSDNDYREWDFALELACRGERAKRVSKSSSLVISIWTAKVEEDLKTFSSCSILCQIDRLFALKWFLKRCLDKWMNERFS